MRPLWWDAWNAAYSVCDTVVYKIEWWLMAFGWWRP